MKIYVAHSRGFDFEKELYEPIRKSYLNNKHTFIFPHENNNNSNSKDFLKNECKLMIAEVSYSATNLGMDLSWANFFKVPIKGIYHKGVEVPVEFRYVSQTLLEYTNSKDLISKIEKIIKEVEKYTI